MAAEERIKHFSNAGFGERAAAYDARVARAKADDSIVLHTFKTIHVDFTTDPTQYVDQLEPGEKLISNFEVKYSTTFQDIVDEFDDAGQYRLYHNDDFVELHCFTPSQRVIEFFHVELRNGRPQSTLFLFALPASLNIRSEQDTYEGQAFASTPFFAFFQAENVRRSLQNASEDNALYREGLQAALDAWLRQSRTPGAGDGASVEPASKKQRTGRKALRF
jgi:hypothetical protein